jgi:MFS family permease/quinol monooxygenase YgiN
VTVGNPPVAAGPPAAPVPVESAWAPLRNRVFRALWLAQLGSAIGTWMQTVGAQWLLLDQPNASALVALVQTANLVPGLLLALPAGVLADAFDRRRLLIAVQLVMVVVGVLLTALTAVDRIGPALLLTFTFLLGCGTTLTLPAWQALIPDLVPRRQLAAAAALGGVTINLARAVGPAIAGVLITQLDVAFVFAVNAATYACLALVLTAWRPGDLLGEAPERFGPALRAGGRYVRHSLVVRRILLRTALFVVPGSALWALLPLVANRRLGLGAGGYGLLLAAVGTGAVAAAFLLPRLRARATPTGMILIASLVYATALLVLGLARSAPLVAAVLVPTGVAWLTVLVSMGATMQLFLPGWVRARGLSVHQMVFLGGQGVAAFGWGVLAQLLGLVTALCTAAAVMAAGAATLRWLPLRSTEGLDRSPAAYWPEPLLAVDPDPEEPVLVQVTYRVDPAREPEFLEAMEAVRRSRRRTGAIRWDLYRDGADPGQFVESYLVGTWSEHLRQHTGRLTGADRAAEQRALALTTDPPEVAHLFPARPPD